MNLRTAVLESGRMAGPTLIAVSGLGYVGLLPGVHLKQLNAGKNFKT